MSVRKTVAAALAALTLGTAVAPGTAQARGYGGVVAAGVIGGLALGAMAAEAAPRRRAVVVEHRYVKRNGRLHYCGCVVRHVVYP